MKREDYSVAICIPCNRDYPWQTNRSLMQTLYSLGMAQIPAQVHEIYGSSIPTIARSAVLQKYLDQEKRQELLFWIDSDVTWSVEAFFRAMKLAKELGVVCGVYPLKKEPVECVANLVPDAKPNEYGCVEINGTGLGFTCIRRDVIERFAETKGKAFHVGNQQWLIDAFREDRPVVNGRKEFRGEDGAFFADLRELGYKIWLDPSLQIGHVGNKEYQLEMMPLEAPNV